MAHVLEDVIWSFERLKERYGRPEHKDPLDPLEELVLTILSQNTNDNNRDRAYRAMKDRFPTYEDMVGADPTELEESIRTGGLARAKRLNIIRLVTDLSSRFGRPTLEHLRIMDDRSAFEELVSMRGVGTKTAACVMVFSLGRPFFPVDTHIHRIAIRMGFVPVGTSRERAQELLDGTVPDEWKYDGHLLLIEHGRRTCAARSPRCGLCAISSRCPMIGLSER